eukprot:SAG31_NODE_40861_length_278_cov_2.810056_2_plen_28_part_01
MAAAGSGSGGNLAARAGMDRTFWPGGGQ